MGEADQGRHWGHSDEVRVYFRQPFLVVGHAVESDARSQSNSEFQSPEHRLFAGTVRHVQNVAGQKLNIFRLALHHLLEIHGNFVLLPLEVFPDYYGMVAFCDVSQSTGKIANLQSWHLAPVIRQDETAGPRHRSNDIDNSRVRNGDDIAGLEDDVVRGVTAFHQFVQIDSDRIVQ